jgi:RNase P/RNase MRP subunit p30
MKRIYADLHLCADINESTQQTSLIRKASLLGYDLVSIPLTFNVHEQQIKQVRDACKKEGLDFASRIDLNPRSPEELLKDLRKVRRRFEIVAVMCYSKPVARQAAKDRRVDLLNFPQPDFRRACFDDAEAQLASTCLASFEIDIKPLLSAEGPSRTRLISTLRREIEIAKARKIPIVISTGVSEQLSMRKPTESAALGALFNLNGEMARKSVSDNPVAIVKRNRQKLSSQFIAPGIRVVRRGEDC